MEELRNAIKVYQDTVAYLEQDMTLIYKMYAQIRDLYKLVLELTVKVDGLVPDHNEPPEH